MKNGWVRSCAQLDSLSCSAHAPSRDKLIIFFLDNTDDQYASQQARYGQAGLGSTGQQRDDWGQGRAGAGRTSEPSSTAAQYGGSERSGSGQTGGYPDTTGGNWQGERDDDETTGTGGGKPTVTSKVKGTSSVYCGGLCWRSLT